MSHSNKSARLLALAAILIIGGGAAAYALTGKKTEISTDTTNSSSTSTTTDSTASSTPAVADTTSASTYKDGTYTATGSYLSPGGTEKIGVTVTLKDDVITDARVKPEPVSDEGVHFQQIFSDNFKQYVIGKDITSLSLSHVSGSSLTPQGFNDAIMQIKAQAKS